MVSKENLSDSLLQSDVEMMTSVDGVEDAKIQDGQPEMTQCPHCSFGCLSLDTLARHTWAEHPLLMRRKKHLITSRKADEVKMEREPNNGGSDQRTHKPSSPPVMQTTIKMEECCLSVREQETKGQSRRDDVTSKSQLSTTTAKLSGCDGRMTSPFPSTSSWVCASRPQTQQRHVAVVKPVPVENKARETPQRNQIDLTQSMLRDKLVYAPLYSVYIPALNQYVTVPIPVGTPSHLGVPGLIGQNFENVKNLIRAQQADGQFTPIQAFQSARAPPQSAPNASFTGPWHGSTSNTELKPLKAVYPLQRSGPSHHSTQSYTKQQHTVKSLLQRDNPCIKTQNRAVFYPGEHADGRFYLPTKTERHGEEKDPFPVAKQRKNFKPPVKPLDIPLIGKERLQALEEALKMTDCCDINNTSSTMPFQCPDGVWRMVTFKCIRGVWLVQIPGYSTPTAYVPCDTMNPPKFNRAGVSHEFPPCGTLGRKRKLSEPAVSEKCDVAAKRSCASAPNPSAQTEHRQVPKIEHMKRALSGPLVTKGLSHPSRYFTNNEGRKVNISMIKKAPTLAATSTSLIKSLLMRKPITEGFRNLAHPAPFSSGSLAY